MGTGTAFAATLALLAWGCSFADSVDDYKGAGASTSTGGSSTGGNDGSVSGDVQGVGSGGSWASGGTSGTSDAALDTASGCQSDNECSDNDLCNGFETCSNGTCVSGTAPDLSDGDSCTDDSCDSLGIHHTAKNVSDNVHCLTTVNGSDLCAPDHYRAAFACNPSCPESGFGKYDVVCKPACLAQVTVCCTGNCACPAGYQPKNATFSSNCICNSSGTAQLCVRP